jgi:uroporphyrinogen decarboxylase
VRPRSIEMLDRLVEARIRAAMSFEEGDRVPIWDYIDNRAIVEHLAPGIGDYGAAMVKVYHELGIDLCRGYGASFAESDDGHTSTNADGTIRQRVSGRTCWKVLNEIQSIHDLISYDCPVPPDEDEKAQWLEDQVRFQKAFEPYTMFVPGGGCGFHATYDLMGLGLFSIAIYDARDAVEQLVLAMSRRFAEFAKAAAERRLCPLYFIGDDIAYKGRLMFSPQFLRETFIPALRRCCEPLCNAGIKVIFHSDGYVMDVLDDMIEAGISGLNPIEPAAGMDIGLLKKRYGRDLILVGNVDCSQILPLGSVEEVVRATKECIKQASPGGGHFVGSSSEITPSTPVENIVAFYRTAREFGAYPISMGPSGNIPASARRDR